jgi:hypothetical protein
LYRKGVKFLVDLAQLAIALTVSGAVVVWVGPTYVAVAALVMATCAVLLFDAARQQSVVSETPIGFLPVLHMLGTSFVFGLIWPSIPLIFTWRRVGDE